MSTPTIASEVARRRRTPRIPLRSLTAYGDVARAAKEAVDQAARDRVQPTPAEAAEALGPLTTEERTNYRGDPVGFARKVLGVKSLWKKQIEILEALRDHRDVAVSASQKVGKSFTDAIAALWFYSCFDDARVIITATSSRQVDGIVWREVRKLVRLSTRKIDGTLHDLARSGLKSEDLREIVGYTATEAEAMAGTSGRAILYIADEASGIKDPIFEAIQGNRAAGADTRLLMTSNPTRSDGFFFEVFHGRSEHYATITVSALDSPNVIEGREAIPGLASREWVERMKEEWGEDSPFYKVRVLGQFVRNEAGRLISFDLIEAAESRWTDAHDDGSLQIGVDPAGPGKGGDESAFAVRRGKKILEVYAIRGMTPEAHVAQVLGLIDKHRRARETAPTVAIDVEGVVGDDVRKAFVAALDAPASRDAFELLIVRSSKPARSGLEQRPIELIRDDLWLQLSRWLTDDGAIPTDAKLERDLHCAEWDTSTTSRRQKVIGKDRMREKLGGRSPDRADAVALAVWQVHRWAPAEGIAPQFTHGSPPPEPQAIGMDPYGGLATWRGR